MRCPEHVGEVPGYIYATGVDGAVGYYRQQDAPPPDPYEYMSIVLQRASAAGAAFVACPNYVKELPGYRRAARAGQGRAGQGRALQGGAMRGRKHTLHRHCRRDTCRQPSCRRRAVQVH